MLKIGIVGLGYWGPKLVRNFHHCPSTEVGAVCELDEDRLAAVEHQIPNARLCTDYDDFLQHIEAVIIATPVRTHYELALKAIEAGLPVLLEKPMTDSYEKAMDLIERARSRGTLLAVDHTFLYTSAIRKIKEYIDDGSLGDIWYYDSVRINLGLFQHDTNVVWDLAPHDFSIMDYLLGREASSVCAHGATHTPTGFHDMAYLHIEFGDSLIAHFHVNWLSPVKIRRVIVGGSRKMVLFDDMTPAERVKVYDRGIDLFDKPDTVGEVLVQYRQGDIYVPSLHDKEALGTMAREFARSVQKNIPMLSDAQQGARVVRLLEACDRSLVQNGKIVRLADI